MPDTRTTRKIQGVRLCATALKRGLQGAEVVKWVLAQELWGATVPSERSVYRWLREVEERGVDLCAALGAAPPRRSLADYREAQHMRLSETIQRWLVTARELEAERDARVLACGDDEDKATAVGRAYEIRIREADDMRLRAEREYAAAVKAIDASSLSDEQVRSEVIAAVLAAADQFTRGEAERLAAHFADLVAQIDRDHADDPDWL